MDRETLFVMNDMLDVVDKLVEIVRELDPGKTENFKFIDFMLARVERTLDDASKVLDQS